MACARRLLLVHAGLLAVAAGLGSPEPGAPEGSRAGEEPLPGNELPAGPRDSRAGPSARPPVRRPGRPVRSGDLRASVSPPGARTALRSRVHRGRLRPGRGAV